MALLVPEMSCSLSCRSCDYGLLDPDASSSDASLSGCLERLPTTTGDFGEPTRCGSWRCIAVHRKSRNRRCGSAKSREAEVLHLPAKKGLSFKYRHSTR
jgi:hypothetical protein